MDNFFQVPNEILDADVLTIYDKMVLVYLYRAGNNHAAIFPSYSTIARKCGMGRSKAINTVKKLEVLSILVVTRRRKDERVSNTNLYSINREALVPLIKTRDVSLNSIGADTPGLLCTLPNPQDTPPSPSHTPEVVLDVHPNNNPVIKNHEKKPNIKNHSIGCIPGEAHAFDDYPAGAISFDKYKEQYGDKIEPDALRAIEYFIAYKQSNQYVHKKMTVESWGAAADQVLKVCQLGDDTYSPIVCEWGAFKAMVEYYFGKKFAPGCDYSLPHFNSPRLKALLFKEAVY